MRTLALYGGMALVMGVILVVSGLRARPLPPPRRRARRPRSAAPPSPERVALLAAVVLGVLLYTRWPVAAVGAGIALATALSAATRTRERVSSAAQAEALAAWAEMLRDATGTPRGIEGVLVATAANAPPTIRPHVVALARRLPYEPLDAALDGLVRDLDHPMGDLIVTALKLSATTGGRQIRGVLDDLVMVAREEARMHTRVEVARARPRAQMRILSMMVAGFVAVVVAFGQGFLEPYSSVAGQMVLLVIGGLWALAVWSMVRLGAEAPTERFLASGGGS